MNYCESLKMAEASGISPKKVYIAERVSIFLSVESEDFERLCEKISERSMLLGNLDDEIFLAKADVLVDGVDAYMRRLIQERVNK